MASHWVPQLYDLIRLHRYDVTSRVQRTSPYSIGVGSVGDVYAGLHKKENGAREKVVIKYIRGINQDRPRMERRLARETMLWGRIRHNHVAGFIGVMYDNSISPLPGLVVAFIPNGLLDYIYSHSDHKRRILREVALGLEYLHATMGIIHGDVQPNNIRVCEDGHAKLIDFGLGKMQLVRGFTTKVDRSPFYTAPELIPVEYDDRTLPPTFHTDVFGFAMVILQILQGPDKHGWTSSRPYNHIKSEAVYPLMRYISLGGIPLRERYPEIDKADWELLTACWNREARRRPNIQKVRSRL